MSEYFGELYLRFFAPKLDKLADREVENIIGIYKIYKDEKKPERIFDLGAGWGRHILSFYKKGIIAYGIEREEVFVDHFRKNAPSQIRDHLIQGDITSWEIPESMQHAFDLVISLFSSIGWSEDKRIFQVASRLLKHEGIFIVDTDNRDGYVIHPPKRTWQRVEGGIALDKHHINWTNSTLLTKREIHTTDGEIYTLIRKMRLYSIHELIQMAKEAGFLFLGAFSNLHMSSWSIRSGRIVLILKKEGRT